MIVDSSNGTSGWGCKTMAPISQQLSFSSGHVLAVDVGIRLLFVKLQVKSVKQIVMQHERERVQMEYELKSSSKHIKQMERG